MGSRQAWSSSVALADGTRAPSGRRRCSCPAQSASAGSDRRGFKRVRGTPMLSPVWPPPPRTAAALPWRSRGPPHATTRPAFSSPKRRAPRSPAAEAREASRSAVWEEALAHGSLLRVGAADNRDLYHAVHKASKKSGPRYSLIFRNIVTMRPVDKAMEAEANDPKFHFKPSVCGGKRTRD